MECGRCHKSLPLEGIKFCPFCGNTLEAAPEERRKGIVVFGDLSGFTALSERIDPDELRDLVDRIMRKFVHIVESHGGFVDKIIGDCIMFLFNVERSYGDDPVRTLRTVEAIQKHLAKFNQKHETTLELHFGIAFGTVSVGVVGNSRTVMGDTVNLAQRLLSAAQSGEVVASPSFAELFPPTYQFEELEPVWLKGKLEPVSPFRYHGRVHFEETLPPYVGRADIRTLLRDQLHQALEKKKGGSLLFQGSAGTGKGRLLAEILDEFALEKAKVIRLTLQEGGDSFPAPLRRLLDELTQVMRQSSESNQLDLMGQDDFWAQADAETLSTLCLQTIRQACRETLVFIGIEHVERADASTLDFIEKLLAQTQESALFLLGTSPKSLEGFSEIHNVMPLSDEESQELFAHLVDTEKAESLGFQKLVEQCRGNPLYIRELARGVNASLPPDKLFSGNIELLLASRLDALDKEQKELVKRASIFGSQVPTKHLAMLSQQSEIELLSHLEDLAFFDYDEKLGLLLFRDELLRVSAYGRINLHTRKSWHQQLAETLLDEDAPPELIAHHFLNSDRKQEALRMSLLAGKRLARNPKQDEALHFAKQAEALARELQNEHALLDAMEVRFEVDSRSLSIDQALERLEMWEKDFALAKLKGSDSRVALLRGNFFFERRMYPQALSEVGKAKEDLPRDKQIELELLHEKILYRMDKTQEVVHRGLKFLRSGKLEESEKGEFLNLLGAVSYIDKEPEQAEDFYQKASVIYKNSQDYRGIWKTVINLGNLARARSDHEAARTYFLEACENALLLGDLLAYCKGLLRVADVNFDLLRIDESLGNFQRALELLKSNENPNLEALVRMLLGNTFRALGDFDRAKTYLDTSRLYYENSQDAFGRGRSLRTLSMLFQDLGNEDRALEYLDQCEPLLANYPDQLQYVELGRVELFFQKGQKEEALARLKNFEATFPEKIRSQSIMLRYRKLDSLLSGRKDPSKLDAIRDFLKTTEGHPIPWKRLTLLAEALEYGPHKDFESEAVDIIHRVRKALPPQFRRSFDRRKDIKRLNELLGE